MRVMRSILGVADKIVGNRERMPDIRNKYEFEHVHITAIVKERAYSVNCINEGDSQRMLGFRILEII